jgi:hypothetical protein
MPGQLSQAERWRVHRLAFELALQLGITPKEAEEELARRAARDRCRESQARLAAVRQGKCPPADLRSTDAERPQPWWLKD